MNFTLNQTYPSKTHGLVLFLGFDIYQGQTTYHFHSLTYNTEEYWLPEALYQHFDTSPPCDHHYEFQQTVYHFADHPLPGSGAHARIYSDRYYCIKCLDTQLRNERELGNSYAQPLPGTLPR
jgi:hypothetical protein